MDQEVVAALVRLRSLSTAQCQGMITAVARLEPRLLLEVAGRADLDEELRRHMLRQAPPHLVVDLLKAWQPDVGLVTLAVEAHGALPELFALCGSRGWFDVAAELGRSVGWRDVRRAKFLWPRHVSDEMPATVCAALVDAALTEREPPPDLTSMPEWERRDAMERLSSERTERASIAWSLLEHHRELWAPLARDGGNAMQVRRILLEYPDELTDEVLVACLPEVLSEQLRGEQYLTGIRLHIAADHLRRWPRLRQIAAEDVRHLVREVTDDGWTPAGEYGGPDWTGIAALAELSDDRQLLNAAIAVIQEAKPSDYDHKDKEHLERRSVERATAVAALARSSHVPRGDLIDLLPILDERALDVIQEHSEGELNQECLEQLGLRRAAEDRRPKIVPVPSDEALAQHDNRVALLRAHLKHLKGRAAQRDATIAGLLGSRFTTPEILRALPASWVLGSAEQADRVAEMLAETCGNNDERWSALPEHCDPPPARTVTFGAWLNQLASLA